MIRSSWLALAAAVALGAGAGCGSSPQPQLVYLPLQNASAAGPAVAASGAASDIWYLSPRIGIPEYLARDAVLLDDGQGLLARADGLRWAEPLREAVARVLAHELAQRRGSARMALAAPASAPGAGVRVLQVDLQTLQAVPARGVLLLRARWSLTEEPHAAAGRSAELQVPLTGTRAADIALAHRTALAALAERIVRGEQTLSEPAPR